MIGRAEARRPGKLGGPGEQEGTGEAEGAEIAFRLMDAEDLERIMELEDELFGEDAWPRSAFQAELFQPETREYWVGEVRTGPEGGREIAAYGGVMCVPPVADIQTIGVARSAQGRGAGRRLLEILIDAARRRAAEDILLEVREDNARARELYARRGFREIHVRKRYYRGGEDAVIMQLDLSEEDA